jgi:hypothetical protein
MGVACNTWRREKLCTVFWWGNLRERDHFEDPGIDGRIDNIMLDIQDVVCGFMDWIDLAHDRGRWLAPVSAIICLRIT